MTTDLFLGLDVGTQGARAIACTATGNVVAEASAPFARPSAEPQPGWHEQQPTDWWAAAVTCVQAVARQATDAGHPRHALSRIAVTSTSGTIVLVDAAGEPIAPA
ncbi:hypothetical protein HQ576_17065, partial [bacterium]|nr:hypothetical protein [bacterium]